MGLGATLISRNVGISIALAALAAGKATSVTAIVNTRNKAIAVAFVLFLEFFILFSSFQVYICVRGAVLV
jgi:hypothetical protein